MLALTRCSQTELDTLNGGYLILQQFKKDHPYITKIFKRSDNASNFSGHVTCESEKVLCNQIGIKILVRDYSEVQKGKDICDRMSGAAKTRLNAWINAGNDLVDAHNVKQGMPLLLGFQEK